jgi:hypothetical protein
MGSQASSLTSTRHRSPLARHLHLVVIPAKSRALTFDVCGLCHRTIPCTTFVLLYFCTFVLCTTFVSPYYSVPLLYFCTFVLCTLFYFCVTALLCTTFVLCTFVLCTFVLCTTFVSPHYSVLLLYFCTLYFVLCTLYFVLLWCHRTTLYYFCPCSTCVLFKPQREWSSAHCGCIAPQQSTAQVYIRAAKYSSTLHLRSTVLYNLQLYLHLRSSPEMHARVRDFVHSLTLMKIQLEIAEVVI